MSSTRQLYMIYETGLSKNRIEALTDGIFAVVMTLLVLDISITEIAILVYGGNSIIIGSLLYIQWWYATRNHKLVDENLDPITKGTSSKRLLFGITVYLIAIGISFVYIH